MHSCIDDYHLVSIDWMRNTLSCAVGCWIRNGDDLQENKISFCDIALPQKIYKHVQTFCHPAIPSFVCRAGTCRRLGVWSHYSSDTNRYTLLAQRSVCIACVLKTPAKKTRRRTYTYTCARITKHIPCAQFSWLIGPWRTTRVLWPMPLRRAWRRHQPTCGWVSEWVSEFEWVSEWVSECTLSE